MLIGSRLVFENFENYITNWLVYTNIYLSDAAKTEEQYLLSNCQNSVIGKAKTEEQYLLSKTVKIGLLEEIVAKEH